MGRYPDQAGRRAGSRRSRRPSNRRKVAVLLVSADFLASSFITRKEIPEILKAEQSRGLVVLPVILSPCQVDTSPLEPFQAVNPPSRPLSDLTRGEKEKVWVRVARAVAEAVAGSDP